ncbi:hypothetical protein [Bremerella sp. P1]|uniref:hypothetical protein n=1 Tax=Bremerella sp. P1 TaxID=3026424 RepID=UPI002367565B|nr:hypothetical protein [Bremerella sp. P1]WDI44238.1 hypothetical protein PSR63_09875 [Bremerella sp. P1]
MNEETELLDKPQLPAVAPEAPVPAERTIDAGLPPSIRSAVRSHTIIWIVILSIGPLGLPLLWLSPKYPAWAKILISLATVFFTVILPVLVTIYCGEFLVRGLLEAMEEANRTGGAI